MQMENLELGTIEVGGKVNVQNVSFHCLEIGGRRVYECQMILDINMILNDETEIKHLSKLRWILKDEEVKELKDKGFIKLVVEN
jgi:hypothetical protein